MYLIEVGYGLPVAQSATSLETVKSVISFVAEGNVCLVAKENLNCSAFTVDDKSVRLSYL